MPIHLSLLMVCLCFLAQAHFTPEVNNQGTVAPITRIIRNYEKHLIKLKEKYDSLHVKRGRLKERSTDSAADARDEVIEDWTRRGDDDPALPDSAPIALSPFAVPVQDIGLLPEPSTVAPKFPHKRRFKYLTQYVKRRPASTTKKEGISTEAMISGDSIFGIEEVKNIVGTNDISDQFDSNPITRVDGDSRRTKTIDEDLPSQISRHDGQVRNERQTKHDNDVRTDKRDSLRELRRKASTKLDQLNGEKLRKRQEQQGTYPIINLFTATMSDDKYKAETTPPSNLQPDEKPMHKSLPIRRLEDAKPLDLKENDLSFNSDEENELPFLTRPDLFNFLSASTPYTSATTTVQPTTPPWTPKIPDPSKPNPNDWLMEDSAFVTAAPIEEGPELSVNLPQPTASNQFHRNQLPTKRLEHASTVVNSMETHELESADLESQIDFEKLYRPGSRRPQSLELFGTEELDNLQYADNDEEFPFYSRRKHRNQQYRFGFRRKPLRRPYYDEEEDFDYYPKMGFPRKGLRFPSRVQRPQAIPLPIVSSVEDQEMRYLERDISNPTLKPPNRYSTMVDGVAGAEKRYTPPADLPPVQQQQVKQEAPSPEDQRQGAPLPPATTPIAPLARPELQMSAENCRKVHNYSSLFGVPDPQAWVRKNCGFVQTFVKAPCEDINTFVDSCYRFRTARR